MPLKTRVTSARTFWKQWGCWAVCQNTIHAWAWPRRSSPSHWPLSLVTQGRWDILVFTVYLPQVTPGTYLSTSLMEGWVSGWDVSRMPQLGFEAGCRDYQLDTAPKGLRASYCWRYGADMTVSVFYCYLRHFSFITKHSSTLFILFFFCSTATTEYYIS